MLESLSITPDDSCPVMKRTSQPLRRIHTLFVGASQLQRQWEVTVFCFSLTEILLYLNDTGTNDK